MLEYILICCSCCCWCWFCVSFLYILHGLAPFMHYIPHMEVSVVSVCVCIGTPLIHRLAELFICGDFCFVLLFPYAFAFVCFVFRFFLQQNYTANPKGKTKDLGNKPVLAIVHHPASQHTNPLVRTPNSQS